MFEGNHLGKVTEIVLIARSLLSSTRIHFAKCNLFTHNSPKVRVGVAHILAIAMHVFSANLTKCSLRKCWSKVFQMYDLSKVHQK